MHYSLQAIELSVKIGITTEEKAKEQILLMDLSFDTDSKKAEASDNIKDIINYQQVYDTAKNCVSGKKWDLVEKLHHDLKAELVKQFPDMQDTSLTLTKFPFEDGAITVGDKV